MDGIWLEPFFIRLDGVVDRRVDHGKVEERRCPGWTSTAEIVSAAIAFNSEIGSAAAGTAHIRQPQMMRPVSLRSPVIVSPFRVFRSAPLYCTHARFGSVVRDQPVRRIGSEVMHEVRVHTTPSGATNKQRARRK